MSPEYVAGFFDGEGCIHLNKERIRTINSKEYLYPDLNIIIGQSGDIGKEFLSYLGTIYNLNPIRQVKTSGLSKQPAYVVTVSGKRAVTFLKIIFPHLLFKKAKAAEAIAFMENYYNR